MGGSGGEAEGGEGYRCKSCHDTASNHPTNTLLYSLAEAFIYSIELIETVVEAPSYSMPRTYCSLASV